MATLQQIEPHQRSVQDLSTLAIRDLVAFFRTLDPENVAGMRAALVEFLPDLADTYGSAAAAMAADWYDDLRDAAGVSGTFKAVLAEMPDLARYEALAGWATAVEATTEDQAVLQGLMARTATQPLDPALALSKLSGGVQRIVANADRETVETSASRDPAQVRYARHASANACTFCRMVATRGAVYRSEASARVVVGRGVEARHDGSRNDHLRKGTRTRGKRALGEKYHDRCHCIAVPVWDGQELEQPAYVKTWEQAYTDAFKSVEGVSNYTPKLLAEMRSTLGSK